MYEPEVVVWWRQAELTQPAINVPSAPAKELHPSTKPYVIRKIIEDGLPHTRNIIYSGYLRSDGLWDIEGVLRDVRAYDSSSIYRPVIRIGELLHDIWIRVTLNDEMTVMAIASSMDATPVNECPAAQSSVASMVGLTIGRGWREAINTRMGSVRGCTHMREMLFNLATATFHTIPFYCSQIALKEASVEARQARHALQVRQCMTWDPESPFMQRLRKSESQ